MRLAPPPPAKRPLPLGLRFARLPARHAPRGEAPLGEAVCLWVSGVCWRRWLRSACPRWEPRAPHLPRLTKEKVPRAAQRSGRAVLRAGAGPAGSWRHTALGFTAVSVSGLALGEPLPCQRAPQTPLRESSLSWGAEERAVSLLPPWDGRGWQRDSPAGIPAERVRALTKETSWGAAAA